MPVRLLLSALLLAAAASPDALPEVAYPDLPERAAGADGFVPGGWRLEATAEGDLDGDRRADLALVLRMTDPANILPNEGGWCGETLDTNPRMLAVALAEPGGGYRLGVANWDLIPRRDNSCAVDWFSAPEQIGIENGTLRLELERMMSAGGWSAGTTRYSFRWQGDDLRLIGFDYTHLRRNSGDLSTLSVNYLSGRARVTVGRIDSDREDVRWLRLHRPGPVSIGLVGDGLEFDPEDLVSNLP